MATWKCYTWLSCGVSPAMSRCSVQELTGLLAPGFLRFHCSKSAIGWFLCASFNISDDLTVVAFFSDTSSRCSDGRRRCSSNRRTTVGRHGGLAFAPFIPVSHPTFKCKNSQGDVKCYIHKWMSFEQRTEFGCNILKMMITYTLAEGTLKGKDTSFIKVEIFLFFAHCIVCCPARWFCPMWPILRKGYTMAVVWVLCDVW